MNALSTLWRIRELLASLQDESVVQGALVTESTARVLSEVRHLAAAEPTDEAFAEPAKERGYIRVDAISTYAQARTGIDLPENQRGWEREESSSSHSEQGGGADEDGPTALGTHGGGGGIED